MMKLPPKATKILDKLCEGLSKRGDHRKIDNSDGAFMAACIEIIDRTHQGWHIVSVAHYFEQNGDLCCDPDVTILRAKDGDYAMTFQQAVPPVFQQPLRIVGGTIHVNEKSQKDLTIFVVEFLTNINEQQKLGV